MGYPSIIQLLCSLGANPEAVKLQGIRSVHVAADLGRSDCVRALLEPPCSADIEAKLMNDTTPLYLASRGGHLQVG